MTDPVGARVERLLGALEKLPPYVGLTYRGLPDGVTPLEETTVTRGLNATSQNPRVATENFRYLNLYAIVSKTGRALGPLSQFPDETEIVLLPGTMLKPLPDLTVPERELTVHLVEELAVDQPAGPIDGLPQTSDELVDVVTNAVRHSLDGPAVAVHSAGKFVGALS